MLDVSSPVMAWNQQNESQRIVKSMIAKYEQVKKFLRF